MLDRIRLQELSCGMKFLRGFIFADWHFFVFCGNLFLWFGQSGFSCWELDFSIFKKSRSNALITFSLLLRTCNQKTDFKTIPCVSKTNCRNHCHHSITTTVHRVPLGWVIPPAMIKQWLHYRLWTLLLIFEEIFWDELCWGLWIKPQKKQTFRAMGLYLEMIGWGWAW